MRTALFLLLTCLVLLFPSMGRSQTPTVVQHVDINLAETNTQTPGNGPFYIIGRTVPLPNVTGAGNSIVVAVFSSSGSSTIPTVTDDKSNTYTRITHRWDSVNYVDMTVFAALNITGGARTITVNWPTGYNTNTTAVKATEFNNVTAVDVHTTAETDGTTITGGSVTPTVANDLLYMVGWQDASTSVFAPGSLFALVTQSNITWQFIPCSTQGVDGSFALYGQYGSTSAIAPEVRVSGTTNYNYLTTTLALKTGTQGTAPGPGIRVVGVQHVYPGPTGVPKSIATQFVTHGNLQVCLVSSGSTNSVSISSAGVNAANWTSRVTATTSNGGAFASQILDSVNTTPGTQTLNVTIGSTSESFMFMFLDIAGAAASPYDKSATTDNGMSGSTTSFTAGSITPGAANELLVNVTGIYAQTATTLQGGTGYNGLCSVETPVSGEMATLQDYSESDDNDAFGIIYATSAASHSFIYNIDEMDNYATGATYFCSATVAYKSTAGTTPTAPPTTPPTVPANVKATVASSSQINLAWTASTDSAGRVAGYTIYRNGAEVGTAVGTSYNDTGLSPDTTYTYTVSAYDASGNQSAQSTPVSATTPKASARRRR